MSSRSGFTTTPIRLKDVATGETIVAEAADGPVPEFIARNIPPLGYRTYVPADNDSTQCERPCDADNTLLENEYFRVWLDPARGTVASLVDKRTGRELVDAGAKHGFGQYLYERFDADIDHAYLKAYCKTQPWPDWAEQFGKPDLPPAKEVPYSAASPRDFQLSVYRGPVSSKAVMTATTGGDVTHDVCVSVTLWQGCPFVDVELAISGKKADPWPEAGWLCFPLKIENPTFRLARLGSVIDPAKDICPGTNHEVFCLSGGMTVSGPDGGGVGLCPLESPLVSLGRPGLFRYTTQWTQREPTVFVNLYNNAWGTNFQQWINRIPSSSVRIWAVGERSSTSALIEPSWEARQSCLAARFDGPAGILPPAQTGIELSRAGVLITAFGPNPDGDGILLRLWEQIGSDEPCCVRLPERWRDGIAQPCNLRGEPQGEPLPIREGKLVVPLRRFAPASVILP